MSPPSDLAVAGITGTNGKTTTAFLLREILEAAGRPCGLLGTVKRVVGGVEEDVERTTPEAIDLQETFRRMADAGDAACVMEVSSHALVLHRADGIHFAVTLFTNLTQDHLDFHADMDDYFLAKRRLFELAADAPAVVNVDDPYGRRLAEDFECVTFSAEGAEADYSARDVSFDATGSSFRVEAGGRGGGGADAAAGALQRRQRARRDGRCRRSRGAAGDGGRRARRRGTGARALRADRRGPGLRRPRRLRPHPRLAGERAARGAAA